MNAIILDTNIISIAHLKEPPKWLLNWFASLEAESIVIPWIVLYETEYGIRYVERTNPSKAADVLEWFEKFLDQRLMVLDMNVAGARLLGQMAACSHLRNLFETQPRTNRWGDELKNDKIRLGGDVMIAAMAIAHQIPIASLNVRDFVHIDRHFSIPGLFDPSIDHWVIDPPVGWGMTSNANDDSPAPFSRLNLSHRAL
ncbi:type II toxin-antitoxin system VapC family toxin [Agrobacterium sp. NPDC090283]|uniref:type II toxin-antitoxin system VapC family toxin n=1 Tax=Agrobacterium sp. NPDC090283 TaxID=3363920 RepID=UPI00383BB60D